MDTAVPKIEPGQRIRITQQVARRAGAWTAAVEGEVVSVEQKKTGSWYAHAKHDRLWLDRVLLRKDDGELAYYNLDQYSHVEILDA
jgi:protein-L-isoaspartate O-methyltransferase